MRMGLPLLRKICSAVDKSCSTFLGTYLPLRMGSPDLHQLHIKSVIQKHRPAQGSFYFGLLLAEKSVVAILKGDKNVEIKPQDINMIANFVREHD